MNERHEWTRGLGRNVEDPRAVEQQPEKLGAPLVPTSRLQKRERFLGGEIYRAAGLGPLEELDCPRAALRRDFHGELEEELLPGLFLLFRAVV